jgi:hypothetical protein
MFDAIRDLLRESPTLRVRVGLRTDLFTLIRSNDPASDKWQSSVIHHSWTNHEAFVLLVKRVETYFDRDADWDDLLQRPQHSSAPLLDPILERRFRGKGLWHNKPTYNVIMSFARRRPRDLVVLLTVAGRHAADNKHEQILTEDLEASFAEFSQGRLTDVVNEFRTEVHGLRNLLLAMKPSKVERTTAQAYALATDEMVKRLTLALDHAPATFTNRDPMTPMALLAFLYRIDFLQARKMTSAGLVDRKYFDQNQLLTPDKIDLGYDWEIQLAFRWVLQPDEPGDIFRFVDPTSTD